MAKPHIYNVMYDKLSSSSELHIFRDGNRTERHNNESNINGALIYMCMLICHLS